MLWCWLRDHLGITDILERLDLMATQEQADRILAKLTSAATTAGNIRQDIADLKAAHPDVDLSALEASVDSLGADLGELDEENPATPPTA